MSDPHITGGPQKTALDSYPVILRTSAVLEVLSLSRTSLWRRVSAGDFPAPIKLGGPGTRAVGWLRADIERWLETRATA